MLLIISVLPWCLPYEKCLVQTPLFGKYLFPRDQGILLHQKYTGKEDKLSFCSFEAKILEKEGMQTSDNM